ncbi:hypothetical protein WJX84_010986 [Apatococcus fuscideae]|uniref:PITH domain-containing protein n=1 Tax=Apatococcus fuscideae TaxID=2026836 RepID=A0AAW1SP46_9CHLO
MDLCDQVDWSAVECLNQQPDHAIANALKQGYREDDGLYLESDTDEQLLLHITFQQAVKLNSLLIKSSGTGDQAPKSIKLFCNRQSLGFSEAADFAAVQEFDLTPEQLDGKPVTLRFVKFQSVNTLSIFVESNQGDAETTIIQKIALQGSMGQTMNVSDIKKAGEEEEKS